MNRIKEFRMTFGYTQKDLAERLETTQQTIARWESGKSEPNIANLRDLSMLFQTSVDDLLGVNPLTDKITTHYSVIDTPNVDQFWGHVGIQLPDKNKSLWFPITNDEADFIVKRINSLTVENSWLTITTLNNRLLLINTQLIKKIQILDDNADEIIDDWELDWDSYQGYPIEVYRALEEIQYDLTDLSDLEKYSIKFKKIIESIMAEEAFTDEIIQEKIIDTHIYFKDSSQSFRVDESLLESIYFETSISNGEAPIILDLSDRDIGLDRYIPSSSIAMLDTPLHKIIDEMKKDELIIASN